MSVAEDGVAYMVLFDGITTVFATHEDVDDAYVQTLGFTRAHPGLQFPKSLPSSIDLRAGLPDGSGASLVIEDVDDTLPSIFGVNLDQSEPLTSNIAAGTAALGASFYDKNIGLELVGSAGQRRRCSCVPTWNVGMAHVSEQQASATQSEASPVSDDPVTWPGRRFALYRLVKDADGNWPDLTDEAERLASRVYWGTLTGRGDQDGKTWTFQVAGIESWLGGSLGAAFTQIPLPVDVGLSINEDANEHVLIGVLEIIHLFTETESDDDPNAWRYTDATTDTALLVGAESYDDVVTALNSFLDILQDDATYGSALSSEGNSGLRYSTSDGEDGIMVCWDRDAFNGGGGFGGGDSYSLRLRVLAHHKIWKKAGYDPLTQNASVDPVENPGKFCLFERPTATSTATAYLGQWETDYPDHWMGTFWSADAAAMKKKLEGGDSAGPDHTSNNGHERWWPPIYRGGCNVFDFNAVNQLVKITTFEPLFLASDNGVPLPHEPDDTSTVLNISGVGDVTHQGIVVFTGPFRDETDPEAKVKNISLPARVAWRQLSDGTVDTDGNRPTMVIYDWPDPLMYGFEDSRPSLWASWRNPPDDGEPLMCRSVMVLEHGAGPDVVSYALARLLASTGAVGAWSGYGLGGGATLTVGPNDLGITGIGDELLGQYTDAETSTHALGIPAEMISIDASGTASFEAAIEAMADDDSCRCKTVLGKVVSARDVIKSLLSPVGWCIGWAGGKYGLFDPFSFQAPNLESGVITEEDIAAEAGNPSSAIPTQHLRKWAPIDIMNLQARLNPITGSFARQETLRSQDQDVAYRKQAIQHSIDGSHLIHHLAPGIKGSNWYPAWSLRWRKISRWWSRQHFECSLTVHASGATEFFCGSPVAVTNAWLVNPAGAVYGVTQAPGYVIATDLNCEEETLEITMIIDGSSMRLYGPAAKVTRYVQNEGGVGYRLMVDDDYLGIRGNTGTLDVEGFAEPAYSSAGGNASIEVFAYDYVTYSGGIYGSVASVHAEAGNCYIQLTGALTGATWLRDQEHVVVLREHANQSAPWPIGVFAPIGNKSGVYTGSTKSPKFKD